MVPREIDRRVVIDRLAWIERMLREIRRLPLDDREAFFADSRNVWTAKSCLRRALEALFDLGRHVLARGFGLGVNEYKAIARELGRQGILGPEDVRRMVIMAGYRNRLVHLYHDVSEEELFQICRQDLGDVEQVADALRRWLLAHPEKLDEPLE